MRMVLVSVVTPFLLLAQMRPQTPELRQEAAREIAQLSRQLRFTDTPSAQRYRAVREEVTAKIQARVDQYIGSTVKPASLDPSVVRQDLDFLLTPESFDPEYSGPPFVAAGEAGNARSLIVAYMLVRGGTAVNDSFVTIRGYSGVNGHFQLVTSNSVDFEGYGLFAAELSSPSPAEQWILVWGPRFGFNGTKLRTRVYAFDGHAFRTVWNPRDVLNGKVIVAGNGFSVEHLDEQHYYVEGVPPYTLHDDYTVSQKGIEQTASHHLSE